MNGPEGLIRKLNLTLQRKTRGQNPNADKDKFSVQTSVDENFKINAEVFFNESAGSSVSVFGSDRKY